MVGQYQYGFVTVTPTPGYYIHRSCNTIARQTLTLPTQLRALAAQALATGYRTMMKWFLQRTTIPVLLRCRYQLSLRFTFQTATAMAFDHGDDLYNWTVFAVLQFISLASPTLRYGVCRRNANAYQCVQVKINLVARMHHSTSTNQCALF